MRLFCFSTEEEERTVCFLCVFWWWCCVSSSEGPAMVTHVSYTFRPGDNLVWYDLMKVDSKVSTSDCPRQHPLFILTFVKLPQVKWNFKWVYRFFFFLFFFSHTSHVTKYRVQSTVSSMEENAKWSLSLSLICQHVEVETLLLSRKQWSWNSCCTERMFPWPLTWLPG